MGSMYYVDIWNTFPHVSYVLLQISMSVRSQASVLMAAVKTSQVPTAACVMRASSHLQTARDAAVSNVYQPKHRSDTTDTWL